MYRKTKKIPTILALLILITAFGAAIYFEDTSKSIISKAEQIPFPEDIRFTNITDSSFSVSWITSAPTLGSLVLVDKLQKFTFLDNLDNDNIPRPRKTHYITLTNLKEDTSYSVKIINGSSDCKEEKYCPVFTQKTAKKIFNHINIPPPRGTVTTADGKPAESAIVYLNLEKTSPLSGRTDSSGLWVIPLNNLINNDLSSNPLISDSDIAHILIKLSPEETSQAVIDIKSIKLNLPLPNMTIGESYNFTDLLVKKDLLAQKDNENILGVKIQPSSSINNVENTAISSKINIFFPSKNNDATVDNQPRFRGTGIPGSQILITLNSAPQTGRITVGKDGTWEWRPPKKLTPGVHHLSIQGYDERGNLITLTKSFIILKSGEQVLGDATPSASLTPTLTLTNTPFPTLPLPSPSPTFLPTVSPTFFPQSPTTTPLPLLRSGNNTPTLLLIGGSLFILFIGLKFLFSPFK